jgi:penicillin-binding protein 2
LGYIREVDQKRIDNSDGLYSLGDYIGITGLEGEYERFLMGRKGIQYIMKDNMGRPVSISQWCAGFHPHFRIGYDIFY